MRKPSAVSTWSEWVKQPHPEENFPTVDGQQLSKRGVSPFAQLIILSVLALHSLVPAIQSFVTKTLYLGQFSAPFEYAHLLEDKTGLPMIFIISPGADPLQEVKYITKSAKIGPQKSL